jgi:hypothetical protein
MASAAVAVAGARSDTRANISSSDSASNVREVKRRTGARFFAARFFARFPATGFFATGLFAAGFFDAVFFEAVRFAERGFAFRTADFFPDRADVDRFVAMDVLPLYRSDGRRRFPTQREPVGRK